MVRIALALVLAFAAGARAQDANDARALFERARHAFETGRFAEARDLLRQSLEITPNTGAGFNLAVALRGTGEAVEAVQVLDALIEGRYGPLSDEQREQAASLRDEVEREVAVLAIHARGAPRIEVRVDGEPIGEVDDGGGADARVDSGRHLVSVHAAEMRSEEERTYVERGERIAVDLRLTERLVQERSVSIVEEPAFWIATASVLVAGVIALVVGLVVYDGQDGLVRDPVFGNTLTLSENASRPQ